MVPDIERDVPPERIEGLKPKWYSAVGGLGCIVDVRLVPDRADNTARIVGGVPSVGKIVFDVQLTNRSLQRGVEASRILRLANDQSSLGWRKGDKIGTALDVDEKLVRFFHLRDLPKNTSSSGSAFSSIRKWDILNVIDNHARYRAISEVAVLQ